LDEKFVAAVSLGVGAGAGLFRPGLLLRGLGLALGLARPLWSQCYCLDFCLLAFSAFRFLTTPARLMAAPAEPPECERKVSNDEVATPAAPPNDEVATPAAPPNDEVVTPAAPPLPPSSDRWNPDGVVFPMVCNTTKEILDAVDKLGIALNKEV
jgi:hypothetical protein